MNKYLVLIGDGMSGWPLPDYRHQTTLELANTPHFDMLARQGKMGLVKNVPENLSPGSDVASLSIFGYDPELYYNGRASLEAVSLGIPVADDEVVFRTNFVTLENGKMKDFTAGHITTEEARPLIKLLNEKLAKKGIEFFCGVSYRHILKMKMKSPNVKTTPPHDITGKDVFPYLPLGDDAVAIRTMMEESKAVLQGSKATQIWIWGAGGQMMLPSFHSKYGLNGGVISAVDLMKGIALASGLNYITVPGITGFIDTNFVGKATYALAALEKTDMVFLHVEAPDEAGHMGDVNLKREAIEHIDQDVLGTILKARQDLSILLLPDHATPIELKTHSRDAVPFVICRPKSTKNTVQARFTEKQAAQTGWLIEKGHDLLGQFIG